MMWSELIKATSYMWTWQSGWAASSTRSELQPLQQEFCSHRFLAATTVYAICLPLIVLQPSVLTSIIHTTRRRHYHSSYSDTTKDSRYLKLHPS